MQRRVCRGKTEKLASKKLKNSEIKPTIPGIPALAITPKTIKATSGADPVLGSIAHARYLDRGYPSFGKRHTSRNSSAEISPYFDHLENGR